ncbi:galactosyltransferase-related protein [Campylobacter jejuni]|uniref:Putative glycosyltransferase involved in capsule biosynthesis n=2 Tax=Campylobacter jejuni TaxID=197 RepID=A0A0S2CG68_CAMJU|nr:galactosyltransferase-related protein [Campylobacter jejuni]ALN44137.1 putative glycosyltransferase involved in capsule biosynthesis [Campylobacter jejuni subsp. jejuni]EAH6174872.1 glycosyltransferase [Campylobacter jejuni]EAI4943619.1 glycosyltransferase [Campylobacter jejuni]EAJ3485995.1 glycosyltransferase [Campylobacter jejuni]EAJ8143356.1 glycosyltransferase [Campylobacter jejuni]
MALLSVIIPFGLSKERPYIEERVLQKAKSFQSDENIEFIFVEGYSSKNHELKNFIQANHHIYLKDMEQKAFSQGKCRNLGASCAHSNVLLFLDVDCYISLDNFEKILKLIQIKNISQNINALMVLPVVYLNKEANEKLKQYDEEFWDILIQEDLFIAKNTWVKFFSPSSTSSIVINKHQFLRLGGNDENFIGHGYEDFDLFARILKACVSFEKMPANLSYDARNWNFFDFKGFRSWFSLLGYEACFYGIYMYHFYHIEPNQNAYMQNKDKNHRLFYKHLKNIKKHDLKPLQVFKAKGEKVLMLFKDRNYDFKDISVYMGEIIYKNISDFFIDNELKYKLLLDFLQQEKITKIFLDASIKLQFDGIDYCDIFYFQKGILPHSWLFAKNLDLDYKQDLNLSEQKLYQVKEYFLTLKEDEKKVILDFLSQNNDDKYDLYKMLYYLINELYSFEHDGIFYQIIIDKEKMLMAQKHDKSFYPLRSFVYKPYLQELRSIRPFSFLMKILGLEYLGAMISHTKFYRLARKLFFNPKGFFEDLRIKKGRN